MSKRKVKNDLTGKIFGNWTVLEQADDIVNNSGKHITAWRCKCSCPNHTIKIVRGYNLINGHSTSCGCVAKELLKKRNYQNTYGRLARHGNDYNLEQGYGIGYTSDRQEFYFDKEDFEKIKPYTWHITACGYVAGKKYGDTTDTLMHRLVMNAPKNKQVHHKNHKKNDNRKQELQLCTNKENSRHKKKMKSNTSGTTGVSWSSGMKKWHAQIMVNYNNINLGYFENIDDAKTAYDIAKHKYFGEFAYDELQEVNDELQQPS